MHSALRDPDGSVRLAGVSAIDGRTQASDFLTAPMAPGYPSSTDGRRAAPPAEWAGDGDVFRAQLQSQLATMARRDQDERVRAAAIGAIHNMVRLQGPRGHDGDVATLFADLYREDGSAVVRRQVIWNLAVSTTDHADLRAILRAAFVDRDAGVRTLAAFALQKLHPALEPRLRYVDVRDEILRGLADANSAYRAAALNAVMKAAQDARELISVLQRMAETDPDETLRQQARRVLELMK
jgi:hypothetical protein